MTSTSHFLYMKFAVLCNTSFRWWQTGALVDQM